ncbi:BglG family transcription antiterminator [Priestia megaterium]|uniref:BglG family transcription antiterminator n=1 Tax=Priestia megaterium TaxID=1404 RepID=UPI001C474C67|nr:PRD domain-containing protein [Priestia megaterium]MBV6738148.1 BglG family transcription antiterminator [Priestia megaterium]
MFLFITSRVKSIIELIIKPGRKHTTISLSTFLNVSARTIHRDLKVIESTFEKFDLRLVRTQDEGLMIEGKNEHIFRLIQELKKIKPTDQSPQERKLILLILLLEEEDSFKSQALAKDLEVSITTLNTYLDEVTEWLKTFEVFLYRKRGIGVEVQGTEANKRKALANYFLVHFNEELIEYLFLVENQQNTDETILHYFQTIYLAEVDRIMHEAIDQHHSKLADSDYIGLIVHICIMIQRTKKHLYLEDEGYKTEELTSEILLMKDICREIEQAFSLSFTEKDIHFLAVRLRAAKLRTTGNVYSDSIVVGQSIKNMITHVSVQLNVDLTGDFSLYQGLLAHMEPAIFRLKQKMEPFNPLTEEIKKKYPFLFMAVRNSINQEFPDLVFLDDEVAYLVLHFGSTLVLKEEAVEIQALIVCPTGIGTSKMLASRIRKEIPEIHSVAVKSVKEIKEVALKGYDIVISTVRLPFFNAEYILVNPLLAEEDIQSIQNFLKKNIQKLTKDKDYRSFQYTNKTTSREKTSFEETMKQIKDVHESIESILQNLRMYRFYEETSHNQVISQMVKAVEKANLITNTKHVIHQLKNRENKGGLGIPQTNMAFFHCREHHVKELIFQVSHLERPCTVKGMDGKPMQVHNLLLMLAPEELSEAQQEILSLISTSLIEDHEAMMIFSSSNEEMIRKKLEDTFHEYLRNNLIKE